MAARAMWKGNIQFSDVGIPVKLYAGVEDRSVHFRLLHRTDQVPVTQKMVHPITGQTVPPQEIQRGYEIEKGRFVVFKPEELEALEPEKSREIRITGFVESERVSHPYYERPYYLGPDSAVQSYFLFAAALKKAGAAAIVRWNMRKKTYWGALRNGSGYLQLITLRSAEQVVDASGLTRPAFRELEEQERRMAAQLVEMLAANFDPTQYHDQYHERVRDYLQAKAGGVMVQFKPAAERKAREASLAQILEQSVQQEQARRERKVG